jgi:hypothetical protein
MKIPIPEILKKLTEPFKAASKPGSVVNVIAPERKIHKYRPKQGFKWNPMLKYPRNEKCYCGSGLKFKKCCLAHQTLAVPKKFADQAAPLVKQIRGK